MKFDIDIEGSAYIFPEETIEDALFRTVAKNLTDDISSKLDNTINKHIGLLVNKSLDAKLTKILDNFLESPVVVGDGYTKTEYPSLLKMVEEKFTASYNLQLSGSACNSKNILVEKIREAVKTETSAQTTRIEKLLKTEAAKMVKQELENSNLARFINENL